jgi:alcohol dehydrogenase class IV
MTRLPNPFLMPMQTRSGEGIASTLITECRAFGPRGILVYGSSLKRSGALARILSTSTTDRTVLPWQHPGGEPTLTQLEELLNVARSHAPDWIAAVGGGCVMDVAKAAAGLMDAPRSLVDYHNGAPIEPTAVTFIAAPTTAGTGSEATMVSVLTNDATGVKKSIRHPSMLAHLVLLDPELLATCPASVIAASGLDALTQAIESFISCHATTVTDQLAHEAILAISRTLKRAYHGEGGYAELLEGSYLAGLALSNARLGIVHGLAHPLGARFHLPHGLVCGLCLPLALAFNRKAMGGKYESLCAAVGGDILDWTSATMRELGIQNPFAGITFEDVDAIVAETLASGSTKANPRTVNEADVHELLQALTHMPSA